jgi:hypothetical protein
MLAEFGRTGFDTQVVNEQRWPELPTPRHRLDPAFRGFDDQDLQVSGFSVVLRKSVNGR